MVKCEASCTELFYAGGSGGSDYLSKPDETWALVAFGYMIQSYVACALSMTEENVSKCHKQYQVCASFADFHLRYQIMISQVPMAAVIKHSESILAIRNAHHQAQEDGKDMEGKASELTCVEDVRGLLSAVSLCGTSRNLGAGRTEQAHMLKSALQKFEPSKFVDGKFPYTRVVSITPTMTIYFNISCGFRFLAFYDKGNSVS